ncbi:SipW-dependent-type signal peptide-containing protein [Mycetocola zhadangensis]|uniref:SipW-dependent-type signal peptide-containing protein n=1 Tax=Mycetocola zhadangensis TaxID=1164595 RepID=UPI0016001928|nr:SipW-dependent-type signal peptide-containing protein [Mycetocola zhadangensis]
MSAASSRRTAFRLAPFAASAAAVLAGIVLLGSPGTLAFWSDQTASPNQTIDSAAGLSLLAAEPVVTSYAMNNANLVSSTVSSSTTGLIPGKLGQRITYTLTGGPTDGAQGYVNGQVTSSAKDAWGAVYTAGYLDAIATATGMCVINPTPTVSGDVLTWTLLPTQGKTMKPGPTVSERTCTITIDLSLPAVKNGVDVARVLASSRGTSTALKPVANFEVRAFTTQVPRSEER